MAKKNNRNHFKRPDSSSASTNSSSGLSEYRNASNSFYEIDTYKDPELIPYCFGSFFYLSIFVWLLLGKNYNLLLDWNSLVIIVSCYTIEFAKFAIHSYLVGKTTYNRTWLKTNPVFWMIQFVSFTVLGLAIAYVTSIFFGAPFTSKQEQTFVFSALITAVLVTPNIIQIGPNILPLLFTNCVEIDVVGPIEEYEKNNFRATVLGAFIGTAVIPFDWETEWQRWPIPCSMGLIIGHLVANVYKIYSWHSNSYSNYNKLKN